MNLISLEELYNQYLNKFKKDGIHPHPSELLALLLLPDKDKYLSLTGNLGDFYKYYKEEIDNKINQVMKDFDLTEEDIIDYIEKNVICNKENYEEHKIWFVFANGFGVLQWGIMYHPDWSPERMHNAFSVYWGRKLILDSLIEETENIKKIGYTKNKTRGKIIPISTTGFKF